VSTSIAAETRPAAPRRRFRATVAAAERGETLGGSALNQYLQAFVYQGGLLLDASDVPRLFQEFVIEVERRTRRRLGRVCTGRVRCRELEMVTAARSQRGCLLPLPW